MEKTTVYFANSEQALYWFMEQTRQAELIKTSHFEIARDNIDTTRQPTLAELLKWCGVYQYPKGKDEKAMVLGQLTKIFNKLEKRTKVILMLTYLGDFATPELFAKAKKNQKVLKQRGYKVVLNYRYTKIKVADMLKINRKTVTRHFATANEIFTAELAKIGFIEK